MEEAVFTDVFIPYSTQKVKRLLLLSITLIILMVLYLIYGLPFGDSSYRIRSLTVICTIAIVPLAAGAVIMLRRLVTGRPGLILETDAIRDYSSSFTESRILWEDIAGIRAMKVYNNRVIQIQLKDPEACIRMQKNLLSRQLMKISYRYSGSPVVVSPSALDITFDELLILLTRHREQASQQYCKDAAALQ